jgi:hypothetical protein
MLGKRSFKCLECGRWFKYKASLDLHNEFIGNGEFAACGGGNKAGGKRANSGGARDNSGGAFSICEVE